MMDSAKEQDALEKSNTALLQEETRRPHDSSEEFHGQARKKKPRDGLLPVSIVGAFFGMLVGMLPLIALIVLMHTTYSVLFLTIPLGICGGIILLKGCRDYRAVILTVVFSLAGIYLTLLFRDAAVFAALYNIPPSNIPMIAITNIGRFDFEISTNFVYALIFAALGILISRELFRKKPAD